MATILIVDDRSTNRELLVTLLSYAGHLLLEAADGEQGLAVARAGRPDLIITDIVMPKMDGYEFARQVRADPVIGKTQIIFYTSSYIVEETRSLAQACGVSLVIGKPIEPEEFLETIRVALENNEMLSMQPVPDEFHHEHMRMLTDTLAKKVEDLETEIIERKQAEEQVRAQAARLKILADASHTFSVSVQDYQAALDQVVRLVVEALADMCQIRLLSDNQERLELAAIYSLDTELSETLRALENPAFNLANDPSLSAQVIRSGKPVLLSSITLEQLWASNPPEYRPIFERFAPHSFILVPLRIEGQSIGGLGLTRYRSEQPPFTEDDLSLAQDLADRAALAINSARLFQQVQNELTERKRAETQLAEAHEFLEKIVTSSPIGILTYKFTGECLSANEYGANILGATVDQLLPQNFRELDSWQRSGLYTLAERTISTRQQQQEDIYVLTTFGKPIWFTAQFVVFQSGAEDCLLLTMTDITERKQVEQALQESEAHYRQIIETAQEGVWTIDANNHTTLVNQRLADMLGYTIEEILNKTIYDFTDEEGKVIGAKSLENRRLGINEQFDFKFIRKDGATVWAILETSVLLDHEDNYAGALAMLTDITERRRADDALKLAYSQLTNLYNNLPQAIFSVDIVQNKMLQASPAHQAVFGYPPEAFFKNPQLWYEIVLPEDKPIIDANYQVLFAGQVVQQQFRILRPDGVTRWIEAIIKPNIDENGKPIRFDGIVSDITERKQIEQALRESQEHYRQIIETAHEGVWAIDTDNRTTLANQRLADMLGYTIEEMIGKTIYEFTDEEGKAIGAKSLENRRLGINEQLDFKYIRKDGGIIWAIIETSSLYDQDGNYTGALAMLTDITERKQAEEKIRQQLQYLTALSEIDRTISSSFDLQLNLATVLVHVIAQLSVDAADVLLFDSVSMRLEYAAGQGFRTRAIEKAPISLSKGHAARAGLNRRPVYIPDLKGQPDDSPRSALFENEGFVSYYAVPLLAKGELNGVLEVFCCKPVKPEKEWLGFLNTLAEQCAIAIENATLFSGLQRSNTELALAYDATIAGWSHALDLRDKETEGHSRRVTEMSLRLAQAMGVSKEEQVQIRRGALLHDIGKMGVPDAILLKPGTLTDEEWVVMKKHPSFAYEMLSPIAYLKPALDIPYCHHEKWDGSGYPRGLKGEQIPLAARIFAIVDVWDALRSDRPYRAAWPVEKVREHIRSLSGTHFDPQVVTVFLESDVMRLT